MYITIYIHSLIHCFVIYSIVYVSNSMFSSLCSLATQDLEVLFPRFKRFLSCHTIVTCYDQNPMFIKVSEVIRRTFHRISTGSDMHNSSLPLNLCA